MKPAHDPDVPAPVGQRRPPKAWRTLRMLVLLCVVAVAMLFVGHRFGDRIGATLRQMWGDLTGGEAQGETQEADGTFFTCGMHPWVILPEPGLCPICHMELTPLDPAKFTGEIAIDPVLAQNIGVRTALVESGPLVGTVRTVGKIDYDETRLHDVDLKVAGWIEELHVDFLGAEVEKGQPLFELYSPELFSAQQDYVLALQQQQQLPGVAHVPRVAEDATSGLEATRTRLLYFGIDEQQIEELETSRQPQKTMTIESPISGTVIRKMAVAGMRVEPGMQMYRIAALGKVWVTVTVYEYQLPFVELGQEATMTLAYVPGREFHGRVTYVYPWTDEKTREVHVRLEFDNEEGLLKPGMFANVRLRRTLAEERTLVSRSAVIDTGERQVAFVSLGGGRFEPRDLRLGIETGGMVEVLAGLEPGEKVVTSAQFLLDSESKIRDGLLRMIRGNLVGTEAGNVEDPELGRLPPPLASALDAALGGYLQVGSLLASDRAAGIAESARTIAAAVDAMLAVDVPGNEHFWHQHDEVETIRAKALEIAAQSDLEAARVLFHDLSVALGKLLRATGVPAEHEQRVEELHCPMFLESQGGAIWLQDAGAVRNPYFGSSMLGCFDRRAALPRAAAGPAAAMPPHEGAGVDAIVAGYLRAAASLAADRTEGLAEAWAALRRDSRSLAATSTDDTVGAMSRAVGAAVPPDELDLAAVRGAFEGLSAAVIELVRASPADRALHRAYCPMVEASWLQADQQLRNPYMGPAMLECGSIQETLPARDGKDDEGERGR